MKLPNIYNRASGFTPLETTMFYTYVLRSKKDDKLYTGATEDLRERFRLHNNGKVFSTKGRGPFELIYYEACGSSKDAFMREKYLKSGPGKRFLKNRLKRSLPLTGFTLIEVLIYSALFSLMMVGMLGGVYMVIQSANQSNARLLVDDEANFVLRKMNWALTGVSSINVPTAGSTGPTLNVIKTGVGAVRFRLNSENIEIDAGSGYIPLDTDNVIAASLSFEHIPASGNQPAAIMATFYLNDVFYETTKYIRK